MNRLFDNLIARERGELKGLSPRLPYLFEHDTSPVELPPAPAPRAAAPATTEQVANVAIHTESRTTLERHTERTSAAPASLNVWPSHAPAMPEPQPDIHTSHTALHQNTVAISQRFTQAPALTAVEVSLPSVHHAHHTAVNTLVTLSPPPEVQSTAKATPKRARKVNVPAPQPAALREPDVHITIGRLEVRAPAAPSPAPARRPAAVPMSLDQYLNRRNGQDSK